MFSILVYYGGHFCNHSNCKRQINTQSKPLTHLMIQLEENIVQSFSFVASEEGGGGKHGLDASRSLSKEGTQCNKTSVDY